MVDVFLIIVICVAVVLLLVSAVYIMVYYQHPDDRNDAYFPKLVVIMGFVIAGATTLLLPLDVANREGYAGCAGYDTALCGGVNMELIWDIFFWIIPLWIFVMIPFSLLYYEADDGLLLGGTSPRSRILQALCGLVVVVIVVGLVFLLTYLFLSDTTIKVQEFQAVAPPAVFNVTPRFNGTEVLEFGFFQLANLNANTESDTTAFVKQETFSLRVDLSTFYAGLLAWVGWFFFCIFGGVGLAAVPFDLISNFVNRPRALSPDEFATAKESIQLRVNEMVEIGEQLRREREEKAKIGSTRNFSTLLFSSSQRKDRRDEQQTLREFKAQVFVLEQDVQDFTAVESNNEKYNPLLPWIGLFFGIISSILSFLWLIHICIYIIPPTPLSGFLNVYVSWFDSWFQLFGVLTVAIFTFYLYICAIKGCFTFGLRFVCITLYPMVLHRTYMSSFLFNLALVLLCSLPVVQFATTAFADYAQFSTIRQIFGVQIENLDFFQYFWRNNIFVYVLLAMQLLTIFYMIFCANRGDGSHLNGQALKARLQANATNAPTRSQGEQA